MNFEIGSLGPSLLEGKYVRLEPLGKEHFQSLLHAAQGYEWPWLYADLSSPDDLKKWIDHTLTLLTNGEEFPFVVYAKSNNQVIGSTRYMEIQPENKVVEIGGTWYTKDLWGAVVNPECKYLLLHHAFEDWGAIRVQLKTDNKNLHSQNAILKLGAKFEGRLRNHRFRRDGSIRDSMMYSITKEEWPSLKSLEDRISSFKAPI